MKKAIFRAILGSLFLAVAIPTEVVFADPYITITNSGSNSLSISVNGTGYNQTIDLVYTLPGSSMPTVISNIGSAYGGYWNGTLNLNEYGITSGSQVYARVGGQQSNTITVGGYYGGSSYYGGCTYNCGSPYGLSLSQNNVYLTVGQSQTITAYGQAGYGYNSNSIYISSNSNPTSVSATVSGNSISLYGLAGGSSTVSVCSSGYGYNYGYGSSGNCASIYVSVGGSVAGANTNLYFSPTNPTMYVGQSLAVSVNSSVSGSYYNYSNNAYYVSSNSNSSVVSATISGTVLNLYANQSGSATINVCHSSLSFCGSLYVTVSGGNVSGLLTFSENNLNLYSGQSRYVSVYNNSTSGASYYISSNSNPSSVTASVSGSQVYVYGQNNGSAVINVCLSGNSAVCGSLNVSVGSYGYSGNINFSQSNPSLGLNQSLTLSVYGGQSGSYYISSNSNSNILTASISGNNLYLYGKNYGSATLTVCQSGYSACGTLYVNVGGGSYGGSLWLSQTSLTLSPYQSSAINIYGSGNYYIASNSNPNAASATVSASTVNIYAYASGSTQISVCQNAGQCASLAVSVSGSGYNYGYGSEVRISNTTLPAMVIGQYYSVQLNPVGGVPPYTFTVNSGGLPNGLNLSASGLLYGVPQYAYTANFSVKATDNQGRSGITPFVIYGSGAPGGSYGGNPGGGGVLGASLYKNGQLIKENGTIYIVYKNTKNGFASLNAFRNFGFSLAHVIDGTYGSLPDSGYVIGNRNTSHPWGSWIKSGQTVYFVHESGLIPLPDWNTFLNNGGQASLIVGANYYDLGLSVLSPMVYDDARLK